MIKINFSKRLRKVLLLSASFLLLFQSCKKEGVLNPEFAEDFSSATFTDTTKIVAITEIGDTILADKISTGLAGVFRDSVFGITVASTHVQALLPSNSLVFGTSSETLTTDSVILSLEYNGYYGDKNISQTIDVYRINELLDNSTSYYSNTNVQTIPSILGSKTFIPNFDSTVRITVPNGVGGTNQINLDPQLRIKLDNSLGDEILAESGKSAVANSENFVKLLNGLKIRPRDTSGISNNEKAILYFALTSSNTKMTIYYTATSQSASVSKSIDFPINSSSARFNTFSHNYTNSEVEKALQHTDSSFTYTLAMAGVQTKITFPTIKNTFKDKQSVINKAELFIPVATGSYSEFGFAQSLILASKDESGVLQFIPDFFEGSGYFGGQFDAASNSYKFNITRYIQGLINGSQNTNGLILLVSGSAVKANRAAIYGPTNPINNLKLNLYYSKTN
ncbi:MAG: DUF4270 family protein [Bacteroidetes bacterium]|nr:MAG: DUF4270 family protein [Bacteroidota bacterium]MBL1143810.1 DUF4270 family protein [Bacteroidota bacterium]NOG56611.1 DUF4270 domain-containing protein [Bacteroidota bacterium]